MILIRKRLSAFFIDMLLVAFCAISLGNLSYLNPYKSQYEKNLEEYQQVNNEFASSMLFSSSSSYLNPKETTKYMFDNVVPLVKKVNHYNIFYSLWYLLFYFLYFVMFTYFNNGQTLGKKLFKIRVVNKDGGRASILNLLVRSIFNGSRLYLGLNVVVIINMLLPLITNIEIYYYSYTIVNLLALVFEISLLIIFLIKRGSISTHDLLAQTKIVEER